MSTATARAATRPASRPARGATGPAAYLRLVVARRSHAPKAPFVGVVVAILASGLLGLLMLNTLLAQDAFRLHALQLQSHVLADQEQGLAREVERLESPESLAARATALKMVPGGPPAFLRLSDGKVLGAALPGAAPPPVAVVPSAPASAPAVKVVQQVKATAPAAGTWVPVPPTRPGTHQGTPTRTHTTAATTRPAGAHR